MCGMISRMASPLRQVPTEVRTSENFICAHAVDRSLLKQGFTLPKSMLYGFTSWFGVLAPGESRDVVLCLDGVRHSARLGNRDFDRDKWPNHPEMYQLRYSSTGSFSKALQRKFVASCRFIEAEMARNGGRLGKKHIELPPAMREQILFYRTANPCEWDVELQTASESTTVTRAVSGFDEMSFEISSLMDDKAHIVLKPALVKLRRLDRTIGTNLKRIYSHRCQICGEQVARQYDVFVDEVHHIDPFVTSLNNNISNLIVLCPTHHRIIHATHADYNRTRKQFQYPNGRTETLQLNYHL